MHGARLYVGFQDLVLHALKRELGQKESSSSYGEVHDARFYAGCQDLVLHALTSALGQQEFSIEF